ncbi:iron complex transport system ATP-binding protein [bacterium A37T11]|nr:iron complex transport system ATP-binding protein [bacterium A37T11]
MIKAESIEYWAGKRRLLHDVSLEVRKGEMLSIIGANGAGKSTLLKLLCGDQKAHAGTISLNGITIAELSSQQLAKMRAVLMQRHTLSVAFTVKEIVLMGRYPHFDVRPSQQDMEVVRLAMEDTGIIDMAARNYHTLSGGEQQRVQLSRVIAQIRDVPHAVLFLDEPTTGLDLLYQQQLLLIAKKMAGAGHSIVTVLHDINFAAHYSDHILILKEGRMVAYGKPREVITGKHIQDAFGIGVRLITTDDPDRPLIFPGDLMDTHK